MGPDTPALAMARLLVTFRALCDVVDTIAAMKPQSSKVGEFQDAAAMPKAIGIRDTKESALGNDPVPSSRTDKTTVNRGMAHFDV